MRVGRQQVKPDVGRPLDGRVRPQWATHGDWGFSSRLRGQRPADSCGTTKTGLNDQAVERGDDTNIETTQAVVAMDHGRHSQLTVASWRRPIGTEDTEAEVQGLVRLAQEHFGRTRAVAST